MTKLPETEAMGPPNVVVAVPLNEIPPVTSRVAKVVAPVTLRVPPTEILSLVLSDVKVPPPETVKLPLIVASFFRLR